MDSTPTRDPDAAHRRAQLSRAVRESLRDLSTQTFLLNHKISGHVDLRAVDLQCLDLIVRHGPLSPRALARRAGLHPATMTGILDRLERGGWVARERDASDRRGVVIRFVGDRMSEILRLYSGMNESMSQIFAGYREDELEVIAGFLRRTADAGRKANDELASR
ncbi:MAG: MarR family transcriptional regulator [Candidatus Dormibacteraeota bacterium]|nr:MarR family transcriptional regulator [Candidatus Dormibacteraeota bacterium]